MSTLTFTASNGVPMLVELRASVQQATGWGRTPLPRPQVVFYDVRYKHTPLGQQITAYYLETLLQRPVYGLMLDGGIPDWTLSKEDFAKVQAWLIEEAKTLP